MVLRKEWHKLEDFLFSPIDCSLRSSPSKGFAALTSASQNQYSTSLHTALPAKSVFHVSVSTLQHVPKGIMGSTASASHINPYDLQFSFVILFFISVSTLQHIPKGIMGSTAVHLTSIHTICNFLLSFWVQPATMIDCSRRSSYS